MQIAFATAAGAGTSGPVDAGFGRAHILRSGTMKHIRTRTEFFETIPATTGP